MPLIPTAFETKVEIKDSDDSSSIGVVLCTNCNISEDIEFIQSSGGYGGDLTNEEDEMAIYSPYYRDYGSVTGNIDFTPYCGQVDDVVGWIEKRNDYKKINIETGDGATKDYNECYLTSLSFNAAENGVLESSIGVEAILRPISDGGFNNSLVKDQSSLPSSINPSWASDDDGLLLIPYWATGVSGPKYSENTVNWNLNFTQSIVKKFFCSGKTPEEGDDDFHKAVAPDYVFVGPLSVDISYTSVIVKITDNKVSTDEISVQDYFEDWYEDDSTIIKVDFGDDSSMEFERLASQNIVPNIVDSGNVLMMDVSYRIHEIKSFP